MILNDDQGIDKCTPEEKEEVVIIEDIDDENIVEKLASMNLTVGDQILELTKRLSNINKELNEQIREKHGALLQQATHAGRFDVALNALADDVQRIKLAAYKLKEHVNKQYEELENDCKVLERLQELSHVLISSKSILILTGKLKNTKDVIKQAELHYELNELMDDPNIEQIEFLQNARTYIINSRQKLHSLAQLQLITGLQEKNEAQVLNAIKIFTNFNTLAKAVDNLVCTFAMDLEQSLKACFAGNDITTLHKIDVADSVAALSASMTETATETTLTPATTTTDIINSISMKKTQNNTLRGPGKTPQLTTTQNFRAKFWKSLHWLIYNELYEYCTQIKLFNRVQKQVQGRFDFITNTMCEQSTLSVSPSPSASLLAPSLASSTITLQFWNAVQNLFKSSFSECAPHINQTLQEGLSKFLSSVRGFEQRLNNEFLFDNNIFKPFEVGYISKCAANMKASLTGISMPNNATIDNFIRVSSMELSAALVDKQLSTAVVAVFMACCKDFCTKLESQLNLGPDAIQVIDMPNAQQIQNTLLANLLYYFKVMIKRMLEDLNEQFNHISKTSVRGDIIKSIDHIDLLMYSVLQPLVDSIMSTINIIVLSVHREPGLNTDKISISGPSMYMKELQEFIQRVWHNHVECFDDKVIVTKCGHEVAKRCINYFIHNIIILRPLSQTGRKRLKSDCLYMENALKPLCPNLIDLGKTARLLRAVSFLIVQTPNELIAQTIDEDCLVSPYIILLLMFGHANVELQSPHTTVNWSNERFIEWLEGHTNEGEKLELISGALQRYRDNVRRKKSEQYDPVYPLMVDFFEKISKREC